VKKSARELADMLAAGQIHDSNRPTLLALARSRGFEAIDLGWLPDDRRTGAYGRKYAHQKRIHGS